MAAPHTEAELSEAIRRHGARHVVLGPMVYTGRLYEALPRGGVLARYGVGHDGIDKALATKAGLFCTNTPGVLHQSVAELTMLLILAAARHLPAVHGAMRDRTLGAAAGRRAARQDGGDRRMRHDRTGRGAHRVGRVRHAGDRRQALGRRGCGPGRALSRDDG